MATENVSIKFYLNDKKIKAEKHPVYVRIIVNRQKAEIATNNYLSKKEWNNEKQRAFKNEKCNESLAEIENNIYDTKYKLQKENQIITAQSIKSFYLNKDKFDVSLLNYFDLFIDKLTKANELVKGSISRYEDTRDHLKVFLEKKKHIHLQISKVNFKLISEFDLFLLSQPSHRAGLSLERNTVNKHHSRLRTVLIRAIKEDALTKNPYNDFELKYTPSKRTFLSHDELDKIKKHSFAHNETLDKVKDIFLFSVYTALRFGDAQNLRIDQTGKDKKGNYFINIIQEKTKEQRSIPLLPPALKIITKYNNEERKITGKVLPKISNQKLNNYLKEIANIIGLKKSLSHHVARHTCATTILLSNDIPIEAVGKWLGHNNIRTTGIYAKITNDYLAQMANRVKSKI